MEKASFINCVSKFNSICDLVFVNTRKVEKLYCQQTWVIIDMWDTGDGVSNIIFGNVILIYFSKHKIHCILFNIFFNFSLLNRDIMFNSWKSIHEQVVSTLDKSF